MAHREKRPKKGSSGGAWPRTRASRAAMEKQRPCRRRTTPPNALKWSIEGTRREATEGWFIQGSRAQDKII